MKKMCRILMAFGIVLGVNGLNAFSQAVGPAAPVFTRTTYPVVDGSTVTIPLSLALGARLTGLPEDTVNKFIVHNKTHQAYLNLINRKADLIFVTSPSKEELDSAAARNITLEVIPIVSEGFVFLTGKDNVVDDLTLQQIVDIYSGKITNWKDLGGYDTLIKAYQRQVNSGSQTGFLELVMKDVRPMTPSRDLVVMEMGELIDLVGFYVAVPDAIGYTYYYYLTDMWLNERVKLLKVNGIYPEPITIRDGTYPIRTAYYAVIRNDEPAESDVRKIVSWVLSDDGQRLCESAGYVGIRETSIESLSGMKTPQGGGIVSRPNPFSTNPTFRWAPFRTPGVLSITRMDGKRIHQAQLPCFQSEYQWRTDHVPPGLYLLKVETAGIEYSRRIVHLQ